MLAIKIRIFHVFSCFFFLSRSCLVGEKPDKELPGIVGARGDTVKDIGNPTMNTPRLRRGGG